MKAFVEIASGWILIVLLVGIPLYGWVKGVKVYEAFVEGAKEGFNVAIRIIPFLVAILAAVGAFRGAAAKEVMAALSGGVVLECLVGSQGIGLQQPPEAEVGVILAHVRRGRQQQHVPARPAQGPALRLGIARVAR